MAESESDRGIHPEVMKQIVDLHRKHSELQLALHDKQGESGDEIKHLTQCIDENTAAVKEQTALMHELIAAIREDVKADRAEAAADKGEHGERAGKRKGA